MTGSFPYTSRAFHSASWVRGFPGECCAAVLRVVISRYPSGSSSAVERQLPKLDVAGSIPVSRSIQLSAFLPSAPPNLHKVLCRGQNGYPAARRDFPGKSEGEEIQLKRNVCRAPFL